MFGGPPVLPLSNPYIVELHVYANPHSIMGFGKRGYTNPHSVMGFGVGRIGVSKIGRGGGRKESPLVGSPLVGPPPVLAGEFG